MTMMVNKGRKVFCDYCKTEAELVGGDNIYPHRPDLYDLKFWSCPKCSAYVGTHKNSNGVPLGRLANRELREAKKRAHASFDPLWKCGGMKRKKAYAWLSIKMGIPVRECHIGMFDVEMCNQVVEAVCQRRDDND